MKQTGQESARELCENFQILIISAVKICKQYLQSASASEELRPQIHDRGFTFRPQTPWHIVPQMKIPGDTSNYCNHSYGQ